MQPPEQFTPYRHYHELTGPKQSQLAPKQKVCLRLSEPGCNQKVAQVALVVGRIREAWSGKGCDGEQGEAGREEGGEEVVVG